MNECCSSSGNSSGKSHFVIIGGGSAAFASAIKARELGAKVTIINHGLPIGGSCVNVGCVPSKTLIRAAEVHHRAQHHNFKGVQSQSKIINFKAVIEQKRKLVHELRQKKYLDVVNGLPDFTILEGHAKLAGPRVVLVNGKAISSDFILIATGARPYVPAIPGLLESGYLTNETAFELEELPESLIVLGGRYIALECAQMFARFGTKVTILQHSSRILPNETPDITGALTHYLTQEGIGIVTNVDIERITEEKGCVTVHASVNGKPQIFQAVHILAATGRKANVENLGLEDVGAAFNEKGFLQVDGTLQTTVNGIYGAGDVIGNPMYVYTAAYEGTLAAENALNGASKERDYGPLPWVIFTDPQVAGVGLDEQQAREQGIDADISVLPLSYVPRSIAAHDTRGFIKLIRNRKTDHLIGARILAPEGSELLMEITLAIKFGMKTNELASMLHPYLTLGEGVKLAAIAFNKDVSKLSCCAT